jgi:hypothetical protein
MVGSCFPRNIPCTLRRRLIFFDFIGFWVHALVFGLQHRSVVDFKTAMGFSFTACNGCHGKLWDRSFIFSVHIIGNVFSYQSRGSPPLFGVLGVSYWTGRAVFRLPAPCGSRRQYPYVRGTDVGGLDVFVGSPCLAASSTADSASSDCSQNDRWPFQRFSWRDLSRCIWGGFVLERHEQARVACWNLSLL